MIRDQSGNDKYETKNTYTYTHSHTQTHTHTTDNTAQRESGKELTLDDATLRTRMKPEGKQTRIRHYHSKRSGDNKIRHDHSKRSVVKTLVQHDKQLKRSVVRDESENLLESEVGEFGAI